VGVGVAPTNDVLVAVVVLVAVDVGVVVAEAADIGVAGDVVKGIVDAVAIATKVAVAEPVDGATRVEVGVRVTVAVSVLGDAALAIAVEELVADGEALGLLLAVDVGSAVVLPETNVVGAEAEVSSAAFVYASASGLDARAGKRTRNNKKATA
jgi:hypothetical protein